MTLQEQALAMLAPDTASLLDSPHARDLAASQLVPVLMTLLLHAKDIRQLPILHEGVHDMLSDMARVCIGLQSQWSAPDQREARATAEALIGLWLHPTPPLQIVTGMRGKVIGMVTREPVATCFYCGRDNPDAVASDYCSRQCAISAQGEGA